MNESGANGGAGGSCRQGIRELVVWGGGPALTADERRRVETHAADCPECSELLSFADAMGRATRAAREAPVLGEHPDPAALVAWVEDPDGLPAAERETLAAHVEACDSCGEEARILARVEAEPAAGARKIRSPEPKPSRSPELPLSRWLDRLRTGLLAPVPAAAYLAIAVLAVGLLLRGPGAPVPDDRVAEPILVSDARSLVRGESPVIALPVFDRERPRPLLLELTGLTSPPIADAVYGVRIVGTADTRTHWKETISGSDFQETFTLVVRPDPTALVRGSAEIRVVGPDGELLFTAPLEIR